MWDGHFTNILIETRVQPSYMNGFFGLSGDLKGSLSMMLKLEMEGSGWLKSLQCLSIAEVVDLECSLTLLPRALEVSPM